MQLWEFPIKIQAYDSQTDNWYHKDFDTEQDLLAYIEARFKVPGKYNLRNTKKWKETGNNYARTVTKPNFEGGRYHNFVRGSSKEKAWRATEVDRIKKGVFYDDVFVPPFYYWYLNYCPIYDDLKKKKRFADVWDGDLWYMQYVMRCILRGKHAGGIKGRQKGYSYKHTAILAWSYWWFENSVNTMGAYDEKLVKKSWRFLDGYRAHLNGNTTWKRGPKIAKSLEWNEVQFDENEQPLGLMSKLVGVTFKQSPDNDVGGSQTIFNYEEPGVSPTLLQTLEFVRPALEKGSETTGLIIACGSVGELEDAQAIKTIVYDPSSYNFLGVPNIWDADAKEGDECGIFISEAYNMIGRDVHPVHKDIREDYTGKPFMDGDGNSDVELALSWIRKNDELIKTSTKKAELKQLALSQKCTSPAQAFAQRTLSEWPLDKLRKQQERIKLKVKDNLWDFKPIKGLLEENIAGKVVMNTLEGGPEHEWPVKADWEDKRGVATMYEAPIENAPSRTYFACVDAVEVDETDTSESIASIDIFRKAIKIKYTDEKGVDRIKVDGDKLVFTYRGRFKKVEETNEQIWLAIKLYNAFTYPERNKPNFINYMSRNGRALRYLATEADVPMFKDLNIKNGNAGNNSKFGFHKGDKTENWKHFKATAKEYFQTEYGRTTYERDGKEEVLKIITGIDKIDDYWLLEEFIHHVEGKGNYDRLVSFLGALFIAKTYENIGFVQIIDQTTKKEKPPPPPPKVVSLLGGSFRTAQNSGRPPRQKSLL
jgi:hypothetical protein